jgi:hypothetical protein
MEGYKWRKDEEEDAISNWITLGKGEDTGELKEKAQDSPLWRIRFGRGYGPAVRQTVWWMKLSITLKSRTLRGQVFLSVSFKDVNC